LYALPSFGGVRGWVRGTVDDQTAIKSSPRYATLSPSEGERAGVRGFRHFLAIFAFSAVT